MKFIDNTTNKDLEKAVLAGLSADSMEFRERTTDESLDELEALLETAGGVSMGRILQKKQTPDPRTFIGEGKVQEVKALVQAESCTLVVFDNELSPSQARALEEDLGVRVLDRSGLILDIFAQRARTREGRLQVELAQYKYLLPRLTGMWTHLERQAGTSAPIGTRGPGETQLETDRRHIRRKISKLEEELEEVRKIRSTQRRKREKNGVPVVALVGYTNAGKSTLLNKLTDAGIPALDRLFDTLDTTTRQLKISDTLTVLVSDTVGFIRKLPHLLVDAFKATLEELRYADLIVHIIDASNPLWIQQAEVVDELILELGAEETPRLEAFNKCDLDLSVTHPRGDDIVELSAKTGRGLDDLLEKIEQILQKTKRKVTLRLPYDKGGVVETLHKEASVLRTDYLESGIEIEAVLNPDTYGRLRDFVVTEDA
ncbi:GTPase HflX [Sporobacter termitidis]|uniref:GTPase HflX n=1 Tax=Sporobacter termitidis TaxID=44749 RepID=UPI001FA8DF9E|nr:GTPase HflX [Sporobacter termitidis]